MEHVQIGASLLSCPRGPTPDGFFEGLRASEIPYVACDGHRARSEVFTTSFDALCWLGWRSLPLSVAFAMHQYMIGTIGTYPLAASDPLVERRGLLLGMLRAGRLLVAVANFDEPISGAIGSAPAVVATRGPNGYSIRGSKKFASLASRADVLLFGAHVEGQGTGLFLAPMSSKGIVLGKPLFEGAMADADTRPIEFHDVVLPGESLLSVTREDERSPMHAYSRAWFQALVTAPYLGAAARAIDEARAFGTSVKVDGRPLADLDGFVVEIGRLAIEHRTAVATAKHFASTLDAMTLENLDASLPPALALAAAAKDRVTHTVEQIVGRARILVGTRSLSPEHILAQLSQQVLFGRLHPQISAQLEREVGAEVLASRASFGIHGF